MRDIYFLAEFVQDLVTCNPSLLIIEDPAHHTRIDREGQRRNSAFHQSQAIKFLQPRIASLFLRADDAYEIFSIVIEHGHIGSKQ